MDLGPFAGRLRPPGTARARSRTTQRNRTLGQYFYFCLWLFLIYSLYVCGLGAVAVRMVLLHHLANRVLNFGLPLHVEVRRLSAVHRPG